MGWTEDDGRRKKNNRNRFNEALTCFVSNLKRDGRRNDAGRPGGKQWRYYLQSPLMFTDASSPGTGDPSEGMSASAAENDLSTT